MKLPILKSPAGARRHPVPALLACAAVLCCVAGQVAAAEVYTWKDADGVTHFSDVPPEKGNSELIDAQEAYRPGTSDAYPESDDSGPALPASESDLFTESGDQIAQQRRDQLAQARQERQEAQAETAALCEQNQALLARLEPARRVMYINDEGEEVRMDDPQRVALIQETKDFVDKNCK
jgi:uncharacterized membrane protein